MKWDDVTQAIVSAVRANATLLTALGGNDGFVRGGAYRVKRVPSVEWFRVTNPLEENTERVHIQFDIWADTTGQAATIEGLLRETLIRHGTHTIGGLLVLTPEEEVDSRDLPDPEPELIHNLLEIVFIPARAPIQTA